MNQYSKTFFLALVSNHLYTARSSQGSLAVTFHCLFESTVTPEEVHVRRSVPQIFPHIILFVLVLMISVAAQGQPRNGNPPDLQQREWALGHIPDEVNSHFTPRNQPGPPQTPADFRRLQIVNNDLMKRFFVLHTADARAIKSALDEIHKLADRLQTSLGFAAPARS